MKLVNLTPHQIDVHDRDSYGDTVRVLTLPQSGVVARVASETHWGHPLRRSWYGTVDGVQVPFCVMDFDAQRVTGLPPEDKDDCDESGTPRTGYVVSLITWLAIRAENRADVLAPGPEIRDETGRIIGCDGLVWDFAPVRLEGVTAPPDFQCPPGGCEYVPGNPCQRCYP